MTGLILCMILFVVACFTSNPHLRSQRLKIVAALTLGFALVKIFWGK
jgi:hypothetical protein